jgi:hypothetical protein
LLPNRAEQVRDLDVPDAMQVIHALNAAIQKGGVPPGAAP